MLSCSRPSEPPTIPLRLQRTADSTGLYLLSASFAPPPPKQTSRCPGSPQPPRPAADPPPFSPSLPFLLQPSLPTRRLPRIPLPAQTLERHRRTRRSERLSVCVSSGRARSLGASFRTTRRMRTARARSSLKGEPSLRRSNRGGRSLGVSSTGHSLRRLRRQRRRRPRGSSNQRSFSPTLVIDAYLATFVSLGRGESPSCDAVASEHEKRLLL